jgi:hypothetical protein
MGLAITAFHVAMLSVLAVYSRLDQNKDGEFCYLEKGEQIPDDGIGGCVVDSAVLLKQFTAWLGIHAAILFSLFAVIAAVAFFALRRPLEGNWPLAPGADRRWWVSWATLRTCLVLTACYALAPLLAGPVIQIGVCVVGDSTRYTCNFGMAALGIAAWAFAHLVAISISSLIFFTILFAAGGLRSAWRSLRVARPGGKRGTHIGRR